MACCAPRRPALVVAVPVAVGDEVPAGAPVLVLESMKMETVLTAPFPARVRALLVTAGGQVETGMPMIRLEPIGDADEDLPATEGVPELELPGERVESVAVRAANQLRDLRDLLLGFDLTEPSQTLADYHQCRAELVEQGRLPIAGELAVFTAFADLCELGRNRPGGEEPAGERVHSPREYFHAYLHSLDLDREQLPDSFRDRLRRALAHYGVTELERTPALEEAVYRIFLAQPGAANHLQLVTALLQQWMLDPLPADAEEVHEVLDRLVSATQLRYPVVGDLARSVRYRWFEQPLVEAERARLLAGVREEISFLAANPQAPDYDQRLQRAGRHSRTDRPVPGRAHRAGHRRPRADARSARPPALPGTRAARPGRRAGRWSAVRHLRLHPGRPAQPPDHHGRHHRGAGAGFGAGAGAARQAGSAAGRPPERDRPLPAVAGDPGLRRPRRPGCCSSGWTAWA